MLMRLHDLNGEIVLIESTSIWKVVPNGASASQVISQRGLVQPVQESPERILEIANGRPS